MAGVEILRTRVRLPDGGEARGFRGHDVQRHAEIDRQVFDARAGELKNLVLDEAVLVHRAAQGDGCIVRADAVRHFTLEVNEDDFGRGDVVRVGEQLLDQLGTALAHAHAAQRAVAGMAVGAEDHAAALGQRFARILVDDRHVRRNVHAAVLLRGGKAEGVVVLVDRTAHGAEAVVAVGQRIGHGEAVKAAGARRLNDTDIGDVVGNQRVKADAQAAFGRGLIVFLQYRIGQRTLMGNGACCFAGHAVYQRYRRIDQRNHRKNPPPVSGIIAR